MAGWRDRSVGHSNPLRRARTAGLDPRYVTLGRKGIGKGKCPALPRRTYPAPALLDNKPTEQIATDGEVVIPRDVAIIIDRLPVPYFRRLSLVHGNILRGTAIEVQRRF